MPIWICRKTPGRTGREPNERFQLCGGEWFREEGVRPFVQGRDCPFRRRVARVDHDVGRRLLRFYLFQKLESIHVREQQIEDHYVKLVCIGRCQRIFTRDGSQHFVFVFQDRGECFDHGGVIVDDQYGNSHAFVLSCRWLHN